MNDTWEKNQKLIESELHRMSEQVAFLTKEIGDVKITMAKIQDRAGIWVFITGGITIIAFIIQIFPQGPN